LFDLGGVVLDIDFDRMFKVWAPFSKLSHNEMRDRFDLEENYMRHERGEISALEYFAFIRKKLELAADERTMIRGWNAMLVGEIAQTVKLLNKINQQFPCYLLTNSNKTHEAHWRVLCKRSLEAFTDIFVSSTMGYRKPEPLAFEYVARSTGCIMASTLFLDDTLANVEGARSMGLQAIHVRTPADIKNALINVGAL
jgi:putative hydrolase of the HAD superfamily